MNTASLYFRIALSAAIGLVLAGEPGKSPASDTAVGPRLPGVTEWYGTYWADDPNGEYPPSGEAARTLSGTQANGFDDIEIENRHYRPTWHSSVASLNNRAAWLFDGENDRAETPAPAESLGSDVELVLVYKLETLGDHNPLLNGGPGARMDVWAHAATKDDFFELRSGQTPVLRGVPDTEARVLFASFKGDGNDRLFIDDTLVIDAETGRDELTTGIRLACRGDESFSRMYVAFFGVIRGGLTTDERAEFLAWATSYYGLSRKPVDTRTPRRPSTTIVPTVQEALAHGDRYVVQDVDRQGDDSTYPGRVFDARGTVMKSNDDYPINIGHGGSISYTTWVGGAFDNALPWEYDWRTLKGRYDGVGIRSTNKGWFLVHGFAARNVMDVFRPKPGGDKTVADRFHYQHCLGIYIRDDFVENDNCMPGTLLDCCANGTYTWHSQQGSDSGGGSILVEDCLVRMEEQPNILHAFEKLPRNKDWVPPGTPPSSVDHGKFDPAVMDRLVKAAVDKGFPQAEYAYGWSQIWKLQTKRPTPVHVQNTLFWAPTHSIWSQSGLGLEHKVDGESHVTYENSVLIWTGVGAYPYPIPAGLTLVDDLTTAEAQKIWDAAYADWLQRHGRSMTDPFTIIDDQKFLSPDAAPAVVDLLPKQSR